MRAAPAVELAPERLDRRRDDGGHVNLTALATRGILMDAISVTPVAAVFAASIVLALALDALKAAIGTRLNMQSWRDAVRRPDAARAGLL